MKIELSMWPILTRQHGQELLLQLTAIAPEALNQYGQFVLRVEEGDPRIANVSRIMEAHGFARISGQKDSSHEKVYQWMRKMVYDKVDINNAQYLWFAGSTEWLFPTDGPRTPGGQLKYHEESDQPESIAQHKGVWTNRYSIIVDKNIMQVLKREQFVGLEFVKCIRTCSAQSRDAHADISNNLNKDVVHINSEERWWEVRSSVELPPMHSSVQMLHTVTRQPMPLGTQHPVIPISAGFDCLIPSYDRLEFGKSGAFDVALTWEYSNSHNPLNRWLVVSHRFYQVFCEQAKERCSSFDWIPINIVNA